MRFSSKLPLAKLTKDKTRERIIGRMGNRTAICWSNKHMGYKKGKNWVPNPSDADVKTLSEFYEITKDTGCDDIVFELIIL